MCIIGNVSCTLINQKINRNLFDIISHNAFIYHMTSMYTYIYMRVCALFCIILRDECVPYVINQWQVNVNIFNTLHRNLFGIFVQ